MNGLSGRLEPIRLGRNRMVRMTVTINGRDYVAYADRGSYDYNEIRTEVDMFTNIWGQAVADDPSVATAYFDSCKLAEAASGWLDRTALLREVA